MNQTLPSYQNTRYCVLNAAYWMTYCITLSFASVFLVGRGYSNTETGVIMAAGQLCGMLLQPIIASLTDRSRTRTPVFFITAAAVVGIMGAALMVFLPAHSLPLTAAFLIFAAINMGLQPLINAFAFYLERLGCHINFGVARGIGSLAFAVMAVLLGWLSVNAGASALPAAGVFSLTVLIVTLHSFRVGHATVASTAPQEAQEGSSRGLLRRNPSLVVLLIGTVLLFFNHAAMNNFMLQLVTNVGGNSADMGALSSYCAALEMPAMFGFAWLRKRFSCTTMLKISAVFFSVKGLLTLLAGSVPMLFVGMLFQSVSFAVFAPASVCYVDEVMSPADANRGQSYVTAMIAAGNILASAVGGILIDSTGVHGFLLLALAVGLAGTALMLVGMKRPAVEK